MTDEGVLLPFLRAALLLAVTLILYPPVAWLDRWAQRSPGDPTPLPLSPLLPIANVLKLLQKRAALSSSADRVVHVAAPLLALVPSLCALATLPLAPALMTTGGASVRLGVARGEGTLPVALALMLLSTVGIAVAGWAGANRLALLGALRLVLLRTAALVVVAQGAAGVCLLHQTLSLDALVLEQARPVLGPLSGWGVLVNPVGFGCTIVALAVLGQRLVRSRPDEHADLVEPYAAEAAGVTLLGHRFFEVVDLLASAGIVTTVFFGGWLIPGVDLEGTTALPLEGAALRVGVFVAKLICSAGIILAVRRSLPPLRHDQAQSLAWVLVVVAGAALALSSAVFARLLG